MGENEGSASLSFKSNREFQEILLQQDRFYKTPYIGHHGWVSIKTEEKIDWNEMGELIKEAYLRAAPKRVVKKFCNCLIAYFLLRHAQFSHRGICEIR